MELRLDLDLEADMRQLDRRHVTQRDVAAERLAQVDVAKALWQRQHARERDARLRLVVDGRAVQEGDMHGEVERWLAQPQHLQRHRIRVRLHIHIVLVPGVSRKV